MSVCVCGEGESDRNRLCDVKGNHSIRRCYDRKRPIGLLASFNSEERQKSCILRAESPDWSRRFKEIRQEGRGVSIYSLKSKPMKGS